MPKQARKVVPICNPVSKQIADLAYQFWLARRFRDGSPELDLLQAMIEVKFNPGWDYTTHRLFLVQKGGSTKESPATPRRRI